MSTLYLVELFSSVNHEGGTTVKYLILIDTGEERVERLVDESYVNSAEFVAFGGEILDEIDWLPLTQPLEEKNREWHEAAVGRDRQFRMNVRNFLLVATDTELRVELKMSLEQREYLRATFIQELLDESVTN